MATVYLMSFMHEIDRLSGNYPIKTGNYPNKTRNYPNKTSGNYPNKISIYYHLSIYYYLYLVTFILAYFYLRYGMMLACKYTNLLCEKILNIKAQDIVTPSSIIIGGGSSNMFTAEELQPFINKRAGESLKFISYLTLLEATELQASNTEFILANVPLITLLTKLTVAELKTIAKCHKIAVHSKSKSQEIQTALSNHNCDTCELYVSIFEMVDDKMKVAKKTSYLQAVKKYQVSNPEYKTYNLQAVKKSQANNPDYKSAHLNAVKKNQASDPNYKSAHINAVKKNQVNDSNYKTFNLNRVVHSSHFWLLFGYFLFYFLVTFSKMKCENDLKMKAKRSLFAKWAYTPHFAKSLLFVFTFCRSFKLRSDAWATINVASTFDDDASLTPPLPPQLCHHPPSPLPRPLPHRLTPPTAANQPHRAQTSFGP